VIKEKQSFYIKNPGDKITPFVLIELP
jgi:hypothetical protein